MRAEPRWSSTNERGPVCLQFPGLQAQLDESTESLHGQRTLSDDLAVGGDRRLLHPGQLVEAAQGHVDSHRPAGAGDGLEDVDGLVSWLSTPCRRLFRGVAGTNNLMPYRTSSSHQEPPTRGFGCPSWFFMAYDCWRSNTIKISTNESRASLELDQ